MPPRGYGPVFSVVKVVVAVNHLATSEILKPLVTAAQ